MFPCLAPCQLGDEAIDALVAFMRGPDRAPANTRIPAGFTYLGQFIDHDITFDPVSQTGRCHDPDALVNFRTPRFDLDSVYGSGPVEQPYLYDWWSEPRGVRLLVGGSDAAEDLPRNQQARAIIGDPRNDEHVIIAQLHLLFIGFHNAVVDHLVRRGVAEEGLLHEAQRIVRAHYQWIVIREFLPAVTGAAAVRREHFRFEGEPFIPVEFSGAVYRFGHSMVRAQYGLRRLPQFGGAPPATPIFPDLAGFTCLDPDLVVDWERFFRFPSLEHEAQPSQRINTKIVGPLFHLPEARPELPRRNLLRGRTLELPSGQDVAAALQEPALTDDELHLQALPESVRDELREAMPLWFYVLCEAEAHADGRHLGPVGGRIVAEVLTGLFEADPAADPAWRPGELGTGDTFTMATLAGLAQAGIPES
jgi:hypothetical protein